MEITADVLVVGAGYLGTRIADELRKKHRVVVTARSQTSVQDLRARGLDAHALDLTHLPDLSRLKARRVVVCAAPSASSNSSYDALYGCAIPAFVQALAKLKTPPEQVLYTSSTGIYKEEAGEWVDENTPLVADTPRRKALINAEQAVLNVRGTVLRLAGIYGPGRHRLAKVRSGRISRNEAESWANLVHVDDAAAAAAHLLDKTHTNQIFLGVDTEPALRLQIYRWIASEWGWPAPVVADETPVGETGKRCSNARLLKTGYHFRFPTYREGYREIRQQGES